MIMLEIKNLVVSYQKENVLNGLSCLLEPGKIYGLIGLNGSGKTTFINCLNGLLKAKTGEILLNNKPLNHTQIALLETHNYFYPLITGREYLRLFPLENQQFVEADWESILNVPLDELISGYSTGMKKKLATMAIAKLDRLVYLLDEPYNGMDLGGTEILNTFIGGLAQKGKIVLLTSHLLANMTALCHSILHLQKGEIQKIYSKDEFNDINTDLFQEFNKNLERVIKF
jgi:ABC-2 type transport system ATP-binding protein